MAETHVPSSWNTDRTDRLKEMWADGQSASQIAVELGDVSRCGVIGKVHRLGLTTRMKPNRKLIVRKRSIEARARRAERERALRIVERAERAEAEPLPPVVAEPAGPRQQRCTIFELTNETCKFPLWADDGSGERFYCGALALQGLPYCEKCAALCFNGPPRKPRHEYHLK